MSAPDEASFSSKPKPETPSQPRGKSLAIGLGALIVALAASWGTGRYQGKLETEAAEKRAADRDTEKKRATTEFDAQRDRAIRLEARRRLHLASLAVEERNFGVAESHLAKASSLLGRAKGDAALDKLAGELAGAKLSATDDLGVTRAKVLAWVKAFDEAMPLPE